MVFTIPSGLTFGPDGLRQRDRYFAAALSARSLHLSQFLDLLG